MEPNGINSLQLSRKPTKDQRSPTNNQASINVYKEGMLVEKNKEKMEPHEPKRCQIPAILREKPTTDQRIPETTTAYYQQTISAQRRVCLQGKNRETMKPKEKWNQTI